MPKFRSLRCILCALFVIAATFSASAQKATKVITWWPDPASGLMWTGSIVAEEVNFAQAGDACSQLQVDGRTGWRLPAIDEFDGVLDTADLHSHLTHTTDLIPTFRWISGDRIMGAMWLWSSTPTGDGGYYSERFYQIYGRTGSKPGDHIYHGVFCVRTMEPEILRAAQAANVVHAVSSLTELQARGPVFNAFQAYNAGQYQQCVDQSKQALSIDPSLGEAYYGLGIAEGMLGRWDNAIADLAQAKKIGVDGVDIEYAQKWAKKNQDAASKGKTLDTKKNAPPAWSWEQPVRLIRIP